MAGTRRFVKVFLASPGDLAEERKIAKVVVDDFNAQLAGALGYQIELVGWEDTLPGVGRPQAIINRDLDGCDLFVGMLWKRWGTAPGTGSYTSGFEEEFERSMARNQKEGRPEINLLMKEIDAASAADPGDHLKKVIAFKQQVFAEKKLLAKAFTDVRDFELKFRRCIQGYVIALAKRDQASESEKDQAPTLETQAIAAAEPTPTTPLSVEGARFLRGFLNTAETASDEQPLAAVDVARVRLIMNIAAVPGNDQQTLGAHDANLIFRARERFDLGRLELHGLLEGGLSNFQHENVPLWHWVAAVSGFNDNLLPISSVIGTPDRRANALRAMRLIAQPIFEEQHFGRRDIISSWFADDVEPAVRVAALEYLSDYGLPSDLPEITKEFGRNQTQTSSAAADAIIRITMRDDRQRALEALYTLQPSTVAEQLLDLLFGREREFSNEALLPGISQRNANVRVRVIGLLKKRGALLPAVAESLLNDSNASVRYEALQALVESGRPFPLDEAGAVLVRKTSGRGVLGFSNEDSEGEAVFEQYKGTLLDRLSVADLEKQERLEVFDQNAYFALVRRNFKDRGDDLRRAVADHFENRFENLVQEMIKRHGAGSDLVEKTRSLGNYLRGRFTREGLNIISSRFDAADLSLVRTMLTSGTVDYSVEDLRYLAKFGQWRDIPLVIASLDRPEFGRRYTSILSMASSTKYEDAAQTVYALGKHRLNDLLAMPMPGSLLARIIPLIPSKAIVDLPDATLIALLRSDSDDVRKMASLKYVHACARRRVKRLLANYMTADHIFYNVIHWLDFGISVPRNRMLRAAAAILVRH